MKLNGRSTDTGNLGHKTQNDDNQNKQAKNTTQKTKMITPPRNW